MADANTQLDYEYGNIESMFQLCLRENSPIVNMSMYAFIVLALEEGSLQSGDTRERIKSILQQLDEGYEADRDETDRRKNLDGIFGDKGISKFIEHTLALEDSTDPVKRLLKQGSKGYQETYSSLKERARTALDRLFN